MRKKCMIPQVSDGQEKTSWLSAARRATHPFCFTSAISRLTSHENRKLSDYKITVFSSYYNQKWAPYNRNFDHTGYVW